jgi:hypothetical protein
MWSLERRTAKKDIHRDLYLSHEKANARCRLRHITQRSARLKRSGFIQATREPVPPRNNLSGS